MNKRVAMSELSPLMAEVLDNDGEVTFTVTGDSMRPLLRHRRDKVCVVKPPGNPLKKYDIPLFVRKDGKYILHRIVAVKPEGYVVIGDNQLVKEHPVLHSQVLGIVKGIWRDGQYISCEDFCYQTYCRLWLFAYPFRRLYLRAKHIFTRMNKFFRRLSR
ncbi:MAG: S24/S26 family peptidase [Desulfitobacteriaceae bacterium]